jgi:hypothetical protein
MKILEKISNSYFEILKNMQIFREYWNFGEYLKIFEEYDDCWGMIRFLENVKIFKISKFLKNLKISRVLDFFCGKIMGIIDFYKQN